MRLHRTLSWEQVLGEPGHPAWTLTQVERDFAGQIAIAVWLRHLDDAAANEALVAYTAASRRSKYARRRLHAALEQEYRLRRDRQDACS